MKTKLSMKARLIGFLMALILLLSMSPFSVVAAEAKPSYVALGDSISTGYGLEGYQPGTLPVNSFTYLLAEKLGYELTNFAVDGNTADGILEQLATETVMDAVEDADLITITAGGNDLVGALCTAIADDYNEQKNTAFTGDDVLAEFADGDNTEMSFTFMDLMRVADIVTNFYDSQAFLNTLESYLVAMFGDRGSPGVIDLILECNPDVTIVINTQYNPYEVFEDGTTMYTFLYSGIESGVQILNGVIAECAEDSCCVADVYDAFTESPVNLCNAENGNLDFHPNAEGHALIAETIVKALEAKMYHYDPIVVYDRLLQYGDKYELDSDSYASYEGTNGNAVLRLVNFELEFTDISVIKALPEKGYENKNGYTSSRVAPIATHLDDLTIVLEGTNSIYCGVDNFSIIDGDGDLTITSESNGSLTLLADRINVRGINVDYNVSIKNCTVDITTTATCIRADAVSFNNCNVTLQCTGQEGTVIPYYYYDSTKVDLARCIAVAGPDAENTVLFDGIRADHKYLRVSVPSQFLDTPTDLSISGTTASWAAVENATAYEAEFYVRYDDEYHCETRTFEPITETSYRFDSYLYSGDEYYFRVRALGDGETTGNSDWAYSPFYVCSTMFVCGINLPDRYYMYNDGTINPNAPADPDMGYAYFEEGETNVLTLCNFDRTADENVYGLIESGGSIEIRLIGSNTLMASESAEYSIGILVDAAGPSLGLDAPSEEITICITGEEDSTLTIKSSEFVSTFGGTPNIIVEEGVAVFVDGSCYTETLTVNGTLCIENGWIVLYGKLVRGENGYLSVAIPQGDQYSAFDIYYGSEKPTDYEISDYITLNGGEVVGADGTAPIFGYFADAYFDPEHPENTYIDYWLTFYDPNADEDALNSALTKVIIRSVKDDSEQLLGDVNSDGQLSSSDVVALMKEFAGAEVLNFNKLNADVNQDGENNTADVVALMKLLVQ